MDEPRRCTAHRTSTGEPCANYAMHGQTICHAHGGRAQQNRAAGERRLKKAAAERAVATYGLPVEIDPHEALRDEVWRTAGHVRWLGTIVAEIEQGDLVWGLSQEKTGGEDWGTTHKAAPNTWLELYHRERQHLVKVCKTAIDAGLAEREVRLAEQEGAAIVAVIRNTLTDLGVDVTPEVAKTVGRHLRAVS